MEADRANVERLFGISTEAMDPGYTPPETIDPRGVPGRVETPQRVDWDAMLRTEPDDAPAQAEAPETAEQEAPAQPEAEPASAEDQTLADVFEKHLSMMEASAREAAGVTDAAVAQEQEQEPAPAQIAQGMVYTPEISDDDYEKAMESREAFQAVVGKAVMGMLPQIMPVLYRVGMDCIQGAKAEEFLLAKYDWLKDKPAIASQYTNMAAKKLRSKGVAFTPMDVAQEASAMLLELDNVRHGAKTGKVHTVQSSGSKFAPQRSNARPAAQAAPKEPAKGTRAIIQGWLKDGAANRNNADTNLVL